MARIAGVDLPRNKQMWIALTYVYGIGRKIAHATEVEAMAPVPGELGDHVRGDLLQGREAQDNPTMLRQVAIPLVECYTLDEQELKVLEKKKNVRTLKKSVSTKLDS